MKNFDSLYDNLSLVNSITQKLSEQKCHVSVDYIQASKISASGDVYVKGQGCFTSSIYPGGSVKINGVFRGGQIYSGGNVL